MNPSRRCLFLTGSLQPYAIDFYRALSLNFAQQNIDFKVVVGCKSTYRPWNEIDVAQHDSLFLFVHGKPAPAFVQKMLGSNARDLILLPGSGIIETLQKFKPDYLIVNERNPMCLTAAAWALLHHTPCFLSTDIGRNPPSYAATKFHLIYHRLLSPLFCGVIAKTVEAETACVRSKARPAIIAPHGIDSTKYQFFPNKYPNSRFTFLFVGVLQSRKGLDTLMEAGIILEQKKYNFEIRLVGEGPWQPEAHVHSKPWLSIVGFKEGNELKQQYLNADAFVLPTRGDTYGVVVHEAAASGLPLIISTAAGACHTLVEHGINGYRIEPDQTQQLADCMEMLIQNTDHLPEMRNASRRLAERWCTRSSGKRVTKWVSGILENSEQ